MLAWYSFSGFFDLYPHSSSCFILVNFHTESALIHIVENDEVLWIVHDDCKTSE